MRRSIEDYADMWEDPERYLLVEFPADGRFQRVFRGPDQSLFCGADHILAKAEVAQLVARCFVLSRAVTFNSPNQLGHGAADVLPRSDNLGVGN